MRIGVFPLLWLITLVLPPVALAGKSESGFTYYQKLTGDDSDSDKSKWDMLYSKNKGYVFGKEPASSLVENLGMLPIGRALDLAMGEGRNAVFMAKKGFEVVGVDISEVAIRKARRLAKENKVHFKAVVADLTKYQIVPESFDVIMVFYYLQRSLNPAILRGLKPGGVLIFENNTKAQLKYDKAASPEYLLGNDELKTMFKGLETLKYESVDDGKAAYALFIGRKPK